MAETQTTGFDRFNEALRNLDEQLHELRERFDDRRKRVEGEVRKRAERIQTDLRKSTVYKRAEEARRGLEDRVERARTQVFDAFGLATKADIARLNRKLTTISKKLSELTRENV
ncbi:MAG: hypothetical protein ACE5FG_00070 [Myxococcota bacterium]